MFSSGNVTIHISNMDRAVHFYTVVLGLKLAYRFGDHWASVELGKGLTIGLHPGADSSGAASAAPKTGMAIGLELTGRIEDAVNKLEAKGVRFGGVINEGKAGKFAYFEDPDGNPLYLAELNWRHVDQGEGKYQHV